MSRQDQAPQRPTVGDTLTVVQRVPAPAGALVQPRLPDDSLVATVLGVPSVQREGDSVRIAYTVTVWAPGRHELRLPGALVLGPDGAVDTLADIATQHLTIPFATAATPADAWTLAQQHAGPNDLICTTGSFFLAAEMRSVVLNKPPLSR